MWTTAFACFCIRAEILEIEWVYKEQLCALEYLSVKKANDPVHSHQFLVCFWESPFHVYLSCNRYIAVICMSDSTLWFFSPNFLNSKKWGGLLSPFFILVCVCIAEKHESMAIQFSCSIVACLCSTGRHHICFSLNSVALVSVYHFFL